MTSAFQLPGARRAVAVVATALVVLTGCADTNVPRGSDPIGSVSPVVTLPPTVGPVGCDPPSSSTELDAGLEVEGAVEGGRDELWALFEGGEIRANDPIDVYWRIGGDKALRITLIGPNDRVVAVTAPRPQPHPDWERPGEPWVSTIAFPQPGCWRVFVERSRRQGDLWVVVD